MLTIFSGGTLAPWLLGGLFLLVLLTLTVTIKAWRDAKRSPYFFMRRQAQQRMQNYSLASLALIAATLFTAAYAQKPPEDSTPRVALINNAKSIDTSLSDETTEVDDTPQVVDIRSGAVPESVITVDQDATEELDTSFATAPAVLPEDFNQVEAEVELADDTHLTPLAFSQEVDDNFVAVNPRRAFSEGSYTLHATFEYEGMANGMAWSWIWRHNGEVLDGGNELWKYGADGPGFVFLNPREGFQPGQYTLQIWVNGELMAEGSVVITTDAVSTSN